MLFSSGGITVTKPSTGVYCLTAGPLTNVNAVAVATADYSDSSTSYGDTAQVVNGTASNPCTPSTTIGVQTYVSGSTQAGSLADKGFTVIIG